VKCKKVGWRCAVALLLQPISTRRPKRKGKGKLISITLDVKRHASADLSPSLFSVSQRSRVGGHPKHVFRSAVALSCFFVVSVLFMENVGVVSKKGTEYP
ncbi:unnamed protein product, partial [Scytosiphon promiscuus]